MKPKVVKAPFFNNKINNQWRDKIKQLMTFYSRTKKLKKNYICGD